MGCNDFRHTYTIDILAEMEKYGKEIEALNQRQQNKNERLIGQLRKNKVYQKDFDKLKKTQEQEINMLKLTQFDKESLKKELNELKKIHEEEMHYWLEEHVKKSHTEQGLFYFMRCFLIGTVSVTKLLNIK